MTYYDINYNLIRNFKNWQLQHIICIRFYKIKKHNSKIIDYKKNYTINFSQYLSKYKVNIKIKR